MIRRVILDTNFLLVPARENVDIFSEIERAVPAGVTFAMMEGSLVELDKIAESGSGKEKAAVKLAKTLVGAKRVVLIPHKDPVVDDAIVTEAKKGDIVATMDKILRSRLKAKDVDTAVLRSRQHVAILLA